MKNIKTFLSKYKHACCCVTASFIFHGSGYLEKTVTRHYHVMHVALDDFIPFNEYFIIPYMMWFLYVAGTIVFFLFRNKEDYYRICTFLFSGMTISLIICTFFHNGTDFRPAIDPGKNIFSGMVAALYQTDTPTNVFPSIHVYNSIGTHIAIMKSESLKKYPWVRAGSAILMVSICLSTVFLKQHSVIDMVGAAIMAYVIYRDRLRIQLVCRRQEGHPEGAQLDGQKSNKRKLNVRNLKPLYASHYLPAYSGSLFWWR